MGQPTTETYSGKRYANVDARNNYGDTPLLDAAKVDNADCVKLLLAWGAQVNTVDNQGDTPLSWAHYYKNAQIITMLKKAGAKK